MSPTQPSQPKVVAAIPCYNEERFIGEVVRQALKYVDQVVVVDDGSHDGTAQVAGDAGAFVANHIVNKGYGAAIKSSFEAAKANGADIVVTMDGDDQHAPDEILALLGPILEGKADLVIGSRFLQQTQRTNIPRYRRLGIGAITWLFNVGSKVNVSDAQSGFRAYRRKVLDTISVTEKGMGISVEALIKARANGFTIREVPISCRYHPQSSTMNPVRHGIGVAFTLAKLRLRSLLHYSTALCLL